LIRALLALAFVVIIIDPEPERLADGRAFFWCDGAISVGVDFQSRLKDADLERYIMFPLASVRKDMDP
jgi:hypothetical protein